MEIVPAPAPAIPNSGPAARQPSDRAALSSDFETFLRMLTAQARYQDPLEPIDASDYAAQLAQFSMVEQQVLSNDFLGLLTTSLGTSSMATLAGWVGMDGRSTAPARFSGSAISLLAESEATADQAYLVVRTPDGEKVDSRPIPVGRMQIEWPGTTMSGMPLPHDVYSFTVESLSDGKVTSVRDVQTYGRIVEARNDPGGVVVVMEGGAVLSSDDITALRAPGA